MDAFDELWRQTRPAFAQERTFERAKRLALSALVCLGRHTITGLITAAGGQFADWSADFRFFENERFRPQALFRVARQAVAQQLEPGTPFVAMMDDTVLRKTGRKVPGTAWRRDPMSPPFHCNFIRGQRILQLSAALPERIAPSRARAIPIDLAPAPSPQRPGRNASPERWQEYREQQAHFNLSQQGLQRLHQLRDELDHDPHGKERPLLICVDGSFTNRNVLKGLPERTVLIGRIRKDAKIYALPQLQPSGRGRLRSYGDRLPTPEQIRQDDAIPWRPVSAFAAGKTHEFEVKTLAPIRWRPAGAHRDLRLVIIRPLGYRPTQNSRVFYRQPAYLICTDPSLPLERLLQSYLWRWEVELNFRDEKTLLGIHQPQVRTPHAVESIPAFFAAAYAFLLLAAHRTNGLPQTLQSVAPKWRTPDPDKRPSTAELISLLRQQLWGLAIRTKNSYGFLPPHPSHTKPEKLSRSFDSACFYGRG